MITRIEDVLRSRSVFELTKDERDIASKFIGCILEGTSYWHLTKTEFKTYVELIVTGLAIILLNLPEDNFLLSDNWKQKTLNILEDIMKENNIWSWGEVLDLVLLYKNRLWNMWIGDREGYAKEAVARAIIDFLQEGRINEISTI